MNAGQHFLHLLWGDDPPGLVQTWTLQDKRSEYWPHWRGVEKDGQRDVFTAVGTTARALGSRQRASAKQIAAIAGMWLDLDIGSGKLPDHSRAHQHLRLCLAPTLVVDSGYGLHAYYLFPQPWVFKSTTEQAEAASLVHRWLVVHKQAAARHGWGIDSVFDLARLMRLPGTLNAKDTEDPRPVRLLEDNGPLHELRSFRFMLEDVELPAVGTSSSGPIDLTGNTCAFAAKLEALLANSPEFEAVWTGARTFGSMSETDLSLCSMAAGAMTDPELVTLIQAHRDTFGDRDDAAKGRRPDYLQRTIRRARSTSTPQARRAA